MIAAWLALSALQAAPPAEWLQGEWAPLAREGSVRAEFDQGTLRRDGDKVRVRIRGDVPEAPGGARWGLIEFELDCRARTWRQLATREYAPDGALLRRSDEAAPAGSAPASAEGRANIERVCGRAGWSAGPAGEGTPR